MGRSFSLFSFSRLTSRDFFPSSPPQSFPFLPPLPVPSPLCRFAPLFQPPHTSRRTSPSSCNSPPPFFSHFRPPRLIARDIRYPLLSREEDFLLTELACYMAYQTKSHDCQFLQRALRVTSPPWCSWVPLCRDPSFFLERPFPLCSAALLPCPTMRYCAQLWGGMF